jgi:hypothetical protein
MVDNARLLGVGGRLLLLEEGSAAFGDVLFDTLVLCELTPGEAFGPDDMVGAWAGPVCDSPALGAVVDDTALEVGLSGLEVSGVTELGATGIVDVIPPPSPGGAGADFGVFVVSELELGLKGSTMLACIQSRPLKWGRSRSPPSSAHIYIHTALVLPSEYTIL